MDTKTSTMHERSKPKTTGADQTCLEEEKETRGGLRNGSSSDTGGRERTDRGVSCSRRKNCEGQNLEPIGERNDQSSDDDPLLCDERSTIGKHGNADERPHQELAEGGIRMPGRGWWRGKMGNGVWYDFTRHGRGEDDAEGAENNATQQDADVCSGCKFESPREFRKGHRRCSSSTSGILLDREDGASGVPEVSFKERMEAEKKKLKELDDKIYKLRRRLRKMEYKKMGINREIDKLEDSIQ
uniref:NS1 n=9 Tax=Isavirus salaris TaxID=55987 RepID=Q910F7_9ORTO|nr:NS1 [Infectious salmon anemia virus]AQT26420.1 ORF2 [Isavirus salaris]AAK51695.1 NS1 [Infectious salmon anemia virus]AAY52773.1 non-structural protein 1 [Infectious salmon anemia virus]AAY52781.1 non-structural protein 1 [Infectious salmon anemia virus]